METLLSIMLFIFIISASLKLLPKLIGFTFSLFIGVIQIMLALMLIPAIGIIFFMGFDTFLLILLLIFLRAVR